MVLGLSTRDFDRKVWKALQGPFEQHARIKTQEKDIMTALRPIFVKHQVHGYVGCALLHRHFDMDEDEIVLERLENGTSISQPTKQPGQCFAHLWQLVGGPLGVKVVPLEFLRLEPTTLPVAENGKTLLLHKTDFLAEYFAKLKQLGLEGVLGLQLIHRDVLGSDETTLVEFNDEDARVSLIKPVHQVKEGKELISTFFIFGEEEDALDGQDFCYRSGNCCCCGGHEDY